MPQIETQALVLEVRDYSETSLLVQLLTRDRGRLGALAKGARRAKSDLAGLLQPFARHLLRLSVRDAGGLATLVSVVRVLRQPDYSQSPSGLERLAYAGLFTEILGATEENDPHSEELFDLAEAFFAGQEETVNVGSHALAGLYALLGALGYAPDLSPAKANLQPASASDAQGPHRHGPRWTLDVANGNLIPSDGEENPWRVPLGAECVRDLLRIEECVQSGAPFDDVPISRRSGRPLMRLMLRLFETHLERRLRSARFVEEMVLEK
jgi:DNA repair protein RecO (recombination protein O)